jgi:hypothetical protein
MSTMRLVVHHTYRNGRAADVSGNGNHGLLKGVTRSGDSMLRFEAGSDEVRVPSSPTLTDPRAIRVAVRFQWAPGVGDDSNRRHNLIEGHLSFALFITPRGGLMGTILDQTGQWRGVLADPTWWPEFVDPGRVQQAELWHDGLSTLKLRLDGRDLGIACDIPGPVRSIGPKGIAIGHWPEPSPVYSFRGWIDTVTVERRDPKVDEAIDDCCADWPAIDQVLQNAQRNGWDANRARQVLDKVMRLNAETAVAVIGNDPARRERLDNLAAGATLALGNGDSAALVRSAADTADFMRERLGEDQLRNVGQQTFELLADVPGAEAMREVVESRDIGALWGATEVLRAFCFPAPQGDPPEHEPQGPILRPGDPDTDQPDGWHPPIVDEMPADEEPPTG